MGIGKQLKKIRTSRGLSRKDLAGKLGITVSSIANYENDISHPKEEILIKMFRVLEVDANQLFQDSFLVDEYGDVDFEMPANAVSDSVSVSEPISDSAAYNFAIYRSDGYEKEFTKEALKELDTFLGYLRYKYGKI